MSLILDNHLSRQNQNTCVRNIIHITVEESKDVNHGRPKDSVPDLGVCVQGDYSTRLYSHAYASKDDHFETTPH